MRRVSMGRILAVATLGLLVAGPVFAQTSDYTTTSSLGVMGNVGVSVIHGISIVGDLGINHKNESGAGLNVGTVTGGVRYAFGIDPSGTVKPFVEGLAGIGVLNAPE